MASRSMLEGIAKGFAVATVAVAVTGEAIALVTKAKEDRVRPQGSPVWSDYLKPGEKISEILESRSSHPFSPSSETTDPLQRPISGPTDGAKSDPFPLVDRDTYISSDDACELLANVRTTARPHMRPLSYRIVKRGFDLAFSSAVVVAGAVPAALLCAAISLDSPGKPIYTQRRIARLMPDGTFRTFRMYKFRTMVEDADAQLENLQELNDADGPMFKIKDDPRVTRTGSYLRVHSFDELPQFINVLTGDMSVVGPRPPLPAEVVTYDSHEMGKLVVPQGLTGFWQVRGRSDTSWEDNVQYDLDYVREFTPLVDLKCVVNTIIQVFTGQGAY